MGVDPPPVTAAARPPTGAVSGGTVRLVIDVGRDEEAHLAGWVSDADGDGRAAFVGTLELLRCLMDRVDAATGRRPGDGDAMGG